MNELDGLLIEDEGAVYEPKVSVIDRTVPFRETIIFKISKDLQPHGDNSTNDKKRQE